jgi:type II restriction enzyme
MRRAIEAGTTPNLLVLQYDSIRWDVRNLLLVPRFAFSMSAIERHNPLSASARRHGWVGCNIVLSSIPTEARISVVENSIVVDPATVRGQYDRLRPLSQLGHDARGWTLDVLRVVREIGKQEFRLDDVYGFERELARLHPQNRHVRDKIRQQLQVLRDLGWLEFLGRGRYRIP